ncbi:ADP-dependent NAD(P)H-hydrate dehydratase [Microbacterium sp. TNHR37B]|uniref:ADP-dependent NAD(P)H-hydrate dehydratase n=1 Tax=Microbacterium sp. TNHR37B TaxID=1775956 RepID=UPI0007B24244|nr:ADP/ATP-dependent (S)-NAD(P)H-hydrate dehydratase [Microbacterium sp. TNHR37B]KZE88978.1 Bifunctional NAD(P)H-hydrate repair enzyme Nnr [Microbacterium sp. TNHR37B]
MDRGWTASDTAELLRKPTASDDKYSRGVVGLRTGSITYPGAAVLGVEAAWRTGVGMVRYVGPERAASLVLARRPETVTVAGRVQAWVVGSGTDPAARSESETAALRELLSGVAPVVVDAGALELAIGATAPRILTPHAGEHARVRAALGLEEDANDAEAVAETARVLKACVVRKGSETIVAGADGSLIVLPVATAWLATAGTGDVLAGTIGAVVAGVVARSAGEPSPREIARAAAAGAWLHARAGALAVDSRGEGPITALDVAESLPLAVAAVLADG